MLSLRESILMRLAELRQGESLRPSDLLALGSRAALHQAFFRLHSEGRVVRIKHGSYAAATSRANPYELLSVWHGEGRTQCGAEERDFGHELHDISAPQALD